MLSMVNFAVILLFSDELILRYSSLPLNLSWKEATSCTQGRQTGRKMPLGFKAYTVKHADTPQAVVSSRPAFFNVLGQMTVIP